MRTMTSRRVGAVLLAVALSGGLAACSDDEDDAATTETTEAGDDADGAQVDLAAACEADGAITAAFNEAPFPEGDEPTDEDRQAMRAWVAEQVEPHLATVEASLDDQGRATAAEAIAVLRDVGETGDASTLESPEATEAFEAVGRYFFEHCDANQIEITAVDYEFQGLDDVVPAGPSYVAFTNGGAELHEMAVAKVADGEERSVAEILELGEEGAEGLIEFVGGTFALQGGTGYTGLDLEPGRYALVCFVPVGMVDPEAESDGPPHFTQGMIHEFTVS